MVTRVGKFVGGLGQDITNTANAHATENRVAFGAAVNPVANVHVVGNVFATTTIHSHTGFLVPDDGDIGSVSATDAMQISSGGIVTFKDDIKIKDGGTIGTATDPAAITIAAAGGVTFSDAATFTGGVQVPDDGDIGSASATDAMQISSAGIVTFKDDILIKDGGTIGVASKTDAVTIAADGDTAIAGGLGISGNTAPVAAALSLGTPANVVVRTHAASGSGNVIIGDATATSSHSLDVRGTANTGAITATTITLSADGGLLLPNDGNIGSAGSTAAMQISSGGIVTFADDIKIKDGGTIGTATDPAAITIAAAGNIGLLGNTAPAASTVSLGVPANAAIRVSSTGVANLILGDATVTSGFNFDVRGTANTGAFTASTVADAAGGGLVPPGTIVPYGGATAPTGYLLCNDAAISRSTYSVLFAIISTAFGTGDGSTTFNVPDLRDRLPLGKGTNNGTVGAITTAASASAVVATAAATQSITTTTGTFASSAKDSATATAVTGVTTSSHTHNITLPAQVANYIIKT